MLAIPFATYQSYPTTDKATRNEPNVGGLLWKNSEKKKKKLTSISARGVRAETESTQIRSIAPNLHIRSTTEFKKTNKIYYTCIKSLIFDQDLSSIIR